MLQQPLLLVYSSGSSVSLRFSLRMKKTVTNCLCRRSCLVCSLFALCSEAGMKPIVSTCRITRIAFLIQCLPFLMCLRAPSLQGFRENFPTSGLLVRTNTHFSLRKWDFDSPFLELLADSPVYLICCLCPEFRLNDPDQRLEFQS